MEGVVVIPQERLPEGIEEKTEDVLVPQSVCYIAPTPVIQDAPVIELNCVSPFSPHFMSDVGP